MKIAVPVKSGNRIDDHFGHCEYYKIFNVDDHEIVDEEVMPSPQGCGCKSNIAADLAKKDVRIMLAGGIGEGAIGKLAAQNIQVIRNCRGDVNDLVKSYLAGELKDGGVSCAAHHEHHEHGGDHVCNHH